LCDNTLNSYCDILVVAAGIVLFLIVEKVVRYVEENSRGAHAWSHGHHHHHHKSSKILKDDNNSHDIVQSVSLDGKEGKTLEMSSEGKVSGEVSEKSSKENDLTQHENLRKVRSWYIMCKFGCSLRSVLIYGPSTGWAW
jgi:zinc transporter 7